MDWSRWMRPSEIERGVRAVRLMMHRLRTPTEVLVDVADMSSMMMRPRKSFVATRVARPQRRARNAACARPASSNGITEK